MFQSTSNHRYRLSMMILLLIIAGTVVLGLSPVSAEKPVMVIVAEGDGSYFLGEEVVFRGTNSDSDSTYLFITGPGISASGGKLTAPHQKCCHGRSGFIRHGSNKTGSLLGVYPLYLQSSA